MTLTKKDFVAIAGAVKETREAYTPEFASPDDVLSTLVQKLIPIMKQANPAFNEETFLNACGPKELR